MKITSELNFSQFKPWSGAVETFNRVLEEGKEAEAEGLLESMYPDGLTETELNDLLWFESEWLLESLGIAEDEDEDEDEDDEDTTEDYS